MAEEYLENPRRAPRVRVRCAAAITPAGGAPLKASSEDVGPHGCQLVSPQPFPKGTSLQVDLASQDTREVLRAAGTVAWCSPHAPWRLGLAFTPATRPAATRFFDKLVAARPGLANWRRVPDKLSLDAMVWLSPPPTRVVDFTAEELTMVRAVGSGATIYELRARLKDQWPTAQRAFFSLLSSGAITLNRGTSAPYQSWFDLLERLEADLPPGPAPTRPAPAGPIAPPYVAPAPQPARPAAASQRGAPGAVVPPAPPPPRKPPPPPGPAPWQAPAAPAAPAAAARPAQGTARGPAASPALVPTPPLAVPPGAAPRTEPPSDADAGPRNDGSAGLDRELDLDALDPEAADIAPLELVEAEPVELVEEIPALEPIDGGDLEAARDWPAEPAAPPDPYAPWPEPPPGKPRGRA